MFFHMHKLVYTYFKFLSLIFTCQVSYHIVHRNILFLENSILKFCIFFLHTELATLST